MRRQVIVIPCDHIIIVDGEALCFAFQAPAELHALQWRDTSGHIEYTDGRQNRALTTADYASEVALYVALWEAEKARLDEAANRPPTLAEQQAAFVAAIQARLDHFARTRNYDGIMSAATYATSTVPKFRAEGQYAVEARDLTLAKAYDILDAVLAGQRPMPTIEEVIAELPQLAWPEPAEASA